jgi:ribosomal protein S18 acetylase RimI-like enzyme
VTPREYAAVLDLLARVYTAEGPRVYLTAGEFEHRRRTVCPPGAQPDARLWWDGDTCTGFAWLDGRYALLVPGPGQPALLEEMLAWSEAHLPPDSGPLLVHSFESDTERTTLLRERGYRPTERAVVLRARPIDATVARPVLPPGYTLRHIAGEADITARAAVYERAFPDEHMPPALIASVTRATHYRPDLDLVVTALDGRFAAFATIWLDSQHHAGVFEPVGCDPAHQRRGLATALMLEGLRRLHTLGATTALVSTGAGRTPANRLYEAVGFGLVGRQVAWEGPHRPG